MQIQTVTVESPDPSAAEAFYASLGVDQVATRASDAPSSGFRGFTLSLVVSQPSTVDALVGTALEAGAAEVKPVSKSFWGYGGVVRTPDGTLLKVASSSKKDKGPATRAIDDVVLLLGVDDVKASRKFYEERGLDVDKGFGSKYVQFAKGPVTLALYQRKGLAKDAGVDPEGDGSHRVAIRGAGEPFTDPDGFAWESAS